MAGTHKGEPAPAGDNPGKSYSRAFYKQNSISVQATIAARATAEPLIDCKSQCRRHAECVMLGVWCWVCDFECVKLGVWCWVCDVECVMLSVWCGVCDFECVMLNAWCWMCDSESVMLSVWCGGGRRRSCGMQQYVGKTELARRAR